MQIGGELFRIVALFRICGFSMVFWVCFWPVHFFSVCTRKYHHLCLLIYEDHLCLNPDLKPFSLFETRLQNLHTSSAAQSAILDDLEGISCRHTSSGVWWSAFPLQSPQEDLAVLRAASSLPSSLALASEKNLRHLGAEALHCMPKEEFTLRAGLRRTTGEAQAVASAFRAGVGAKV